MTALVEDEGVEPSPHSVQTSAPPRRIPHGAQTWSRTRLSGLSNRRVHPSRHLGLGRAARWLSGISSITGGTLRLELRPGARDGDRTRRISRDRGASPPEDLACMEQLRDRRASRDQDRGARRGAARGDRRESNPSGAWSTTRWRFPAPEPRTPCGASVGNRTRPSRLSARCSALELQTRGLGDWNRTSMVSVPSGVPHH